MLNHFHYTIFVQPMRTELKYNQLHENWSKSLLILENPICHTQCSSSNQQPKLIIYHRPHTELPGHGISSTAAVQLQNHRWRWSPNSSVTSNTERQGRRGTSITICSLFNSLIATAQDTSPPFRG